SLPFPLFLPPPSPPSLSLPLFSLFPPPFLPPPLPLSLFSSSLFLLLPLLFLSSFFLFSPPLFSLFPPPLPFFFLPSFLLPSLS
ncbi:hypothetical protein ACXWRW_10825, partial [Streptococcus pyogenes]